MKIYHMALQLANWALERSLTEVGKMFVVLSLSFFFFKQEV